MSESTSPVLMRSVSSDGTCRCNFSESRAEICCASVFESGMWHVPVFGREQVEEEAIQRTAVDIVTLPLPADASEVELLEATLRRDVCLDRPRVHGLEPELGKRQREHVVTRLGRVPAVSLDRKSTRLNSSHSQISYAVFCLKKKKTITNRHSPQE